MKRSSHIIGIGLLTLMSSVTLAGTTQVGTANVKLPFVALESGTTPETFQIKVADGNGKVSSFEDQIRALHNEFVKSIQGQTLETAPSDVGSWEHAKSIISKAYGSNSSAWDKSFTGAEVNSSTQWRATPSLTRDGNLKIVYQEIRLSKSTIYPDYNYFVTNLPFLIFESNRTLIQTLTVIPKFRSYTTLVRQNEEKSFGFSGFDERTTQLTSNEQEPDIKLPLSVMTASEKTMPLLTREKVLIARLVLSDLVEKYNLKSLPLGLNSDIDLDEVSVNTLNLHYAAIIEILKEQR